MSDVGGGDQAGRASDESDGEGAGRASDESDGEGDRASSPGPERDAALSAPVKASLLWGLVGGLSFLVLVQGYELATDRGVTLGVKAGTALLVAVGAAVSTHLARR
ncbi:MAG: hypothetical protein ABEJ40_00735 [Haloarculaceae archaeon]